MAAVVDRDPTRPDPWVLLTPREVARLFGVTPKTVARWDGAGILPAERTEGGHRRFPAEPVFDLYDALVEVGDG